MPKAGKASGNMKTKSILVIILGGFVGLVIGGWYLSQPEAKLLRFDAAPADPSDQTFTYADYATVLGAYVNDQGMVLYKAMLAHRQKLDAFGSALGKLEPKVYDQWSEKEQISFWINAYNALTLEAILTYYPIQSSWLESIIFPKNSIRQIPGVWDKLQFIVMGRKLTLGQIEHEILRKQFNEPRIHMALVCAAMGCPPLRNEPFIGSQLDEQLDDQASRFLSDRKKFRIEASRGQVYLSPIFKWFGEDFVRTFGTDQDFPDHGPSERAVLNFISRYLGASDREYLAKGKYEVKYLDYDWSLNDQQGSETT
jgi:Protein of unknown function, DUF547